MVVLLHVWCIEGEVPRTVIKSSNYQEIWKKMEEKKEDGKISWTGVTVCVSASYFLQIQNIVDSLHLDN